MLGFLRFHNSMSEQDKLNALNANFGQIEQQSGLDQQNSAISVDANGWTVLNVGMFTIYTKHVSTSLTAFTGPAFITGLASNFPVGVADFNAALSASASFSYGNSGAMRVVQESHTTASTFNVVGTTSSAITTTIHADYQLIVAN